MKKLVSIHSLVLRIYEETKKAFLGTENEDNFLFHHDALSLMTASDTLKWMKEEKILQHWILPEQGLNRGTSYENCIPGNAPEFNALDSSLNRNIHSVVLEHVLFTASFNKTDKQKFSVSTPRQQDSAYLCLWDPSLQLSLGWDAGVTGSHRIVEDMAQSRDDSILKQYSVWGIVIHGCGTCRGDRNEKRDIGETRGGARSKKPFSPAFIHEDAISAVNESLAASMNTWMGSQIICEGNDIDCGEINGHDEDDVSIDQI